MIHTKNILRSAALLVGLHLAAGIVLIGCGGDHAPDQDPAGGGTPGGGDMPPTPVSVVVLQPTDVERTSEYPGRVRGIREIEVRARVGGILERRMFAEGQRVEEGEPLFQIDEAPYQIALRMARAEHKNAEANYRQAERDWRRISGLFEQNAVSERERDTALSAYELAQARLESTNAHIADAELQLEYTRVPAPISGYTGMETLSEGSLIEQGTLVTSIVQNDPVQVRFAIPERDAMARRGAQGQEVQVLLPTGEPVRGVVDFTDSSIDSRTGAIQVRAKVENRDERLVPGQFVRVRLPLEKLESIFAITPAAISEGPAGRQVFVLKSDNTVEARSVRLGPVVDGKQLVLEGLADGDKLVVSGHVSLRPGMSVEPEFEEEEGQ